VNDLLARYEKELENPGEKLYNITREILRNQAYTDWKIAMNEALVRASVIRYLINHNTDRTTAKNQLKSEFVRGFFWMRDLVDCLGVYEKSRDKYPTLESYMPVIIDFYKVEANKSDSMFDMKE
jgi:hypothetical protein